MQNIHYAPTYLANPLHNLNVTLIGAGGNGSQMLSALARINYALEKLERKGLNVLVFDPDTVEEPNIGRQLFTPSELGRNKAEALVTRFNRFYGTSWDSVPSLFDDKRANQYNRSTNIFISCTDSVSSRKEIDKVIQKKVIQKGVNRINEYSMMYWMDLGNSQNTGQVILGSNDIPQPKSKDYGTVSRLPFVTEEYDLDTLDKHTDEGPSCSMAEALSKQDLFINSTLVQGAASLLWNILIKGYTFYRGFYLNLGDMQMSPINL